MKIEIVPVPKSPVCPGAISCGRLGEVVSAHIDYQDRLGRIFIAGIYMITFLDNGAIWETKAANKYFTANPIPVGTQVMLTQE